MTVADGYSGVEAAEADGGGDASFGDARRCWGCRRLWPRAAMRWGTVHAGPVWYPRSVRVLRCGECLAA